MVNLGQLNDLAKVLDDATNGKNEGKTWENQYLAQKTGSNHSYQGKAIALRLQREEPWWTTRWVLEMRRCWQNRDRRKR